MQTKKIVDKKKLKIWLKKFTANFTRKSLAASQKIFFLSLGKGQGKDKARSRQGQGKVMAMSKPVQNKVRASSWQGQGED